MYGWLVRIVVQRVFARLSAGDTSIAVCLLSEDSRLRFPGRGPFAGEHRSREAVARWYSRFAHFRPQFEIHDVLAGGPPWNIRASVHFTDRIGGPDDDTPYMNEGVCLFRLRWGKVTDERIFLDTQALADFFGTESAEEFFAGVDL